MPSDVLEVTKKFNERPHSDSCQEGRIGLEGIHQYTSVWNERGGSSTLCDLYDTLTVTQAVIYQ